jgi:hypothetical protein
VSRPDPLDPDAAADAGAALGQLATALPDGGVLLSAARLVESGCRATLLIAPHVVRLDVTPQDETLQLHPRVPDGQPSVWEVSESTLDGYRDTTAVPLELRGEVETVGARIAVWVHVLAFADSDAAATYFVAKAELRPAS